MRHPEDIWGPLLTGGIYLLAQYEKIQASHEVLGSIRHEQLTNQYHIVMGVFAVGLIATAGSVVLRLFRG